MRLRVLALGDDMTSSTTRWYWKSLVSWDVKFCCEQQYGTSSVTNGVGDHGEDGMRLPQHYFVEYSREGLKPLLGFVPAKSSSREIGVGSTTQIQTNGLSPRIVFVLRLLKTPESDLNAPEEYRNPTVLTCR